MQIKTTMEVYLYILIRITIKKIKPELMKVERLEPLYALLIKYKMHSHFRKQFDSFFKS